MTATTSDGDLWRALDAAGADDLARVLTVAAALRDERSAAGDYVLGEVFSVVACTCAAIRDSRKAAESAMEDRMVDALSPFTVIGVELPGRD